MRKNQEKTMSKSTDDKSDTGNNLRDCLIDLSNNENLRKKFAKDPGKIMDKYDLSASEKKMIQDGDIDGIKSSIGDEFLIAATYINVAQK